MGAMESCSRADIGVEIKQTHNTVGKTRNWRNRRSLCGVGAPLEQAPDANTNMGITEGRAFERSIGHNLDGGVEEGGWKVLFFGGRIFYDFIRMENTR